MNKRIKKIIENYFDSKISDSETKELIAWIEKGNEDVFNEYVSLNFLLDQIKFIAKNKRISSWEKIASKINSDNLAKVVPLYKRSIFKYAAAFLIFASVGYFFLSKDNTVNNVPIIVDNNIEMGTDKATLTLEDGSEIALEKGGVYVSDNLASNGEEIVYKATKTSKSEIAYNYLTIPRGGQYFVKFSDGTQVWLNSESKLKYPVHFIKGAAREVELVYGEAYFDVSRSTSARSSTFKVLSGAQKVEVLGTEFNIKAYKDENSTYTTLVEGKVAVSSGEETIFLKPKEQSRISASLKGISVVSVDVTSEISWKNGVFSFKNTSLEDLMKVISRWYDVDVIFLNKNLKNITFRGVLGKDQDITEILATIKAMSVVNNYEINNKTVILK